ncbi:MAG: HAD family hydrolase [bacterium]
MTEPRDVVLIFDLDNTLIHSTIDFLGLRHRLIDLLLSAGAASAPREVLIREAIPHLVALGEAVDPALGQSMWEVVAEAEQLGLQHAHADTHAADVLRALRGRGYRLAVLTNNARTGVLPKLDEFGLTPFFNLIATRNDVDALKPSAAGVRYVLDRMPGVRAAWLIGDAWIDGLAAREAGIPFVGIGPRQSVALERGATPVAWIAELQELLDFDFTRGA